MAKPLVIVHSKIFNEEKTIKHHIQMKIETQTITITNTNRNTKIQKYKYNGKHSINLV